ncbi:hypothetical protein EUGRSUZ_C00415 [Eucalyptus grandis]|uniref:Uncharacterized protein n=2 Tax=Eucalyptus grandis TaxID=71139 RepID=A0ACC3L9R9_EUCGR|nr:hypothetical protein EUGRSUZ_C00415 [Eucalyptus grandis]
MTFLSGNPVCGISLPSNQATKKEKSSQEHIRNMGFPERYTAEAALTNLESSANELPFFELEVSLNRFLNHRLERIFFCVIEL